MQDQHKRHLGSSVAASEQPLDRDATRDHERDLRVRLAYRGDGSFRAHLFGVARFILLGWTRRNRTYEPADDDLLAATEPTPSGVVARQQQLRIIATALRRLPVDDQILIELKDWEDLSQAELAALFAVPQPTVARRLQRARARLHAAVEALCVDPAQRDESLRNLESCLQSIRAQIVARWGIRAPPRRRPARRTRGTAEA